MLCRKKVITEDGAMFWMLDRIFLAIRPYIIAFALLPFGLLLLQLFAALETVPITNRYVFPELTSPILPVHRWRFTPLSPREKQELAESTLAGCHVLPNRERTATCTSAREAKLALAVFDRLSPFLSDWLRGTI